MAGDLNSKHINRGCHVTNPNDSKLQAFITNIQHQLQLYFIHMRT
jgi:hypothetical protein